ncbi:hypothetical protein DMH04_00490 [Kibdelosporangium aridum]|uniref:Ricin B lectin domain-containing protein n=1 Tax=Kibdelosporangium aridum TaxID=2030 RepID=A0A428ZTX1_KIBAR|nr:RICIN domain-containing protein [Kibdelosporangium aridum]RSM91520.1 hypothetical protein DMH04_00490 [Kibdelosporangium aridum]
MDTTPRRWRRARTVVNQQFALRKVTYAGNDPHDFQLVAGHSGKCADINGVSTAVQAVAIPWTCKSTSRLDQTWRLWGGR